MTVACNATGTDTAQRVPMDFACSQVERVSPSIALLALSVRKAPNATLSARVGIAVGHRAIFFTAPIATRRARVLHVMQTP